MLKYIYIYNIAHIGIWLHSNSHLLVRWHQVGQSWSLYGVYLDLEVLYNLGSRGGVRCVADAGTHDTGSEHCRKMLEWYRKIWRAHTCPHTRHHKELAVLSILWLGSWTWAQYIRLYIHHTSAGTTAESSLPSYGWCIPTIQSSPPSTECPTCEDICHIPFRFAMARENKCGLPWRRQAMLRVGKLSAFPGPSCHHPGNLDPYWRLVELFALHYCYCISVSEYLPTIFIYFHLMAYLPGISGIVGRHRYAGDRMQLANF